MWSDYMKAPNLRIAQMWKDLLDGEGLPARLIAATDLLDWSQKSEFRILVPEGRQHVADEIIRKL